MIDWSEVRHFIQKEFDDPLYPGSGQYIYSEVVFLLDNLRDETGWTIITHKKVGGVIDLYGTHGHGRNSLHRKDRGCKAVDWHFKTSASSREQIHKVLNSGFTGIGIYYNWHWNNEKLKVGFHTDVRKVERTQLWKCVEKGKYIYLLE